MRSERTSASIVKRYKLDSQGSILSRRKIFLSSVVSRLVLGSTHPIQWVLGAVSPAVKRQGHEADHCTSTYSAEVKNGGAVCSLRHVFMAWCLII
jgi:hypothetical protein